MKHFFVICLLGYKNELHSAIAEVLNSAFFIESFIMWSQISNFFFRKRLILPSSSYSSRLLCRLPRP